MGWPYAGIQREAHSVEGDRYSILESLKGMSPRSVKVRFESVSLRLARGFIVLMALPRTIVIATFVSTTITVHLSK